MSRRRNKRPLLGDTGVSRDQILADDVSSDDLNERDEATEFVSNRHKEMAAENGIQDSESDGLGDEPENTERRVFDIHTSDSEGSDEDDGLEDEQLGRNVDEEKEDWGGSRKNWYGGDTHEYEIMNSDERNALLNDEEEEAVRLQKKALHRMRREDFLVDDSSDSDDDGQRGEQDLGTESPMDDFNHVGTVVELTAHTPELDVLLKEFQRCSEQLSVWKERVKLNDAAGIKYQLLSLLVTNVAFYFALRTDPNAKGVDLRTHPVLSRIIQIRSLLHQSKSVSLKSYNSTPASGRTNRPDNGERGEGKKNAVYDLPTPTVDKDVTGNRGQSMKKKTKKGTKKSRAQDLETSVAFDEERVVSLLRTVRENGHSEETQTGRDGKRRRLNKIVGAMERERKNNDAKRMASADMDVVREEIEATKRSPAHFDNSTPSSEPNGEDVDDDEEVMGKMLETKKKKEARKAKKAALHAPHVYTFKDDVDPGKKRKASTQIIKNRGLTRHRPKDKKTPRTKNRLAYGKAVVRRKGAVREYAGSHGGSYGGETSGINMAARKSSKLS